MGFAKTSAFLSRHFVGSEGRVLKVQVLVILLASALLTVGHEVQQKIQSLVLARRLQVLLPGWDGLAWLVWPLAAPVILILIRQFPLVRGKIKRHASWLVLWSTALLLVIVHLRFAVRLLSQRWFPGPDLSLSWPSYAVTTILLLPWDLITFSGFFSASFAIHYYFRLRQRAEEALQFKLRTAQLESDLAQAELKALRGQLHPHFLFNSFNAVTTLMRQRRNDAAVEVIAQLSTLLRLAIDRPGKQELSLDDEMDFIRRYLQIEWIRFGEKLLLNFEIESAARVGVVPNLLLQPLVENAIKHGISRRSTPGAVSIRARRTGERLEIEVENDGPDPVPSSAPPPQSNPRTSGIGLSNTHARLEKIYGTDYRLEMIHREDCGMLVRINLPWRRVSRSS